MEFQEGTESGLDGSGFRGGGGAQTWEIKLTFIDSLLSAKSFRICSHFEEESFVPPRFPVLGWLQEGSRLWRFLNYSLTLGGLGRSLGVSDQIHILGKLINRGCGAQFPPPPHGGARRHPSHPQGGGSLSPRMLAPGRTLRDSRPASPYNGRSRWAYWGWGPEASHSWNSPEFSLELTLELPF